MKKSIIAAGAASVALAAMPVLGVFADDTEVVDTIEVTVQESCTFRTIESSASAADTSYAASGTNATGSISPLNGGSNVHTFNVFCNNNSGYVVSAVAEDLEDANVSGDVFAYATSLPTSSSSDALKKDGKWNATIAAGTGLEDAEIGQIQSADTSADIVTHNAASIASGETFTAAYTAWIGTETPAGTYSGNITYTLSAND